MCPDDNATGRPGEPGEAGDPDDLEPDLEQSQDLVELAVTDVLDLHSFPPREVASLVRDYLDLARERGFAQVRIIHGRGRGVQRDTVRRILAADARVEAFGDAPLGAGGWGATWVRFRPPTG